MSMAPSVRQYLDAHRVRYDTLPHPRTATSMRTAQLAHIPGDNLAKCVVLKDKRGYLLAVVPATHRLDLDLLRAHTHRDLVLVDESELTALFSDCDPGAIPPLADAYGLDCVFDDRLLEPDDIYFEAGDHEQLVHLSTEQYRLLMSGVPHRPISQHV